MRVKHITKEDCLRAMRHTKSNRAAARYLGVSSNVVLHISSDLLPLLHIGHH